MLSVLRRGKPPVPPMSPLPTNPDDPRLENWYHTIELAPGVTTRNCTFDLRAIIELVGLPESLVGKSALDVGTATGFWAFEMERRGADRVVAIDVAKGEDCETLPILRENESTRWSEARADYINHHMGAFATAQAMRKSRVEWRRCSVYDLSPKTVGTFDVVYCGSLLLHLFNPLQALINIRSVTREMAIVESSTFHPDDPVMKQYGDQPYMRFGELDLEKDEVGSCHTFWKFTPRALRDIMIYAGFKTVESRGTFKLPSMYDIPIYGTSVVARV